MKHIYVCTSQIEGMGIRIGDDAKKGEVIFRFKGPLKFKINQSKEDALANPDWVGVAKDQWIDPDKPYKFINHSCNPNTGIKGKVTVVALRDIKEGEELTIDYSTIEGDPRASRRTANLDNMAQVRHGRVEDRTGFASTRRRDKLFKHADIVGRFEAGSGY